MKYLFMTLLAALSLPAISQTKQNDVFTLTGGVTNLQDGYVYLRYTDKDGKYIKDSAALQNGAFRFSGHIVEPTMASFSGKLKSGSVDDPNYTNIFLEPGEMNIIVADQAFKEAKLTGSVSQQEYASLAAQQNKIEKRWRIVLDTLHNVNKRSNFEYQELKDWVLTPYFAERKEVEAGFIKSHPASYVTASILRNGRDYATDTLKKIYAAFPVKLQQSSYGKAMLTELENRKKGVPGAPAADFTTTDINGQPLSLADYKGKYVLIDFWASWCLPCRKLNPHLKELYTQCGPKGFEVIGIASDDKTPDAWKKAVAQDGLPWRQILAGNIGRQYDIQELPTQILIDPNGKIIARYGSGLGDEAHAALDKKLETLFGAASSLQAHAPTKTGAFVVNGKYKGQPGDMLYLGYTDAGNTRVKDSCVVMDGTFSFKGAITEPTMAYLQPKQAGINNGNGNGTQLFLEPAVMQLNVDAKNIKEAVLTGSATQKEWVQFEKAQEPIRKEMEPLSASYSAAGKAYMDAKKNNAPEKELDTLKYRAAAIHDQFEPYNARIAKLDYHYFETHPTSVVTAYYLRFYVNGLPLDSIQLFYDRLGTATQQTSFGKLIAEEMAKLQSGSPGSMAKNFSTADINGKPLSLSNFKGKYVLIDFWASWCVPCRKGNPHLKELYAQYKEKGFEVIGVADDDRDTAAWHKAVTKDGLPWQHVLRGLKRDSLKGYDKTNDISELFGIHSLPTQVLVDPSGKIIARYGEGASAHEELDKKLSEVFKGIFKL